MTLELLKKNARELIMSALTIPEEELGKDHGRDILLYNAIEFIFDKFLESNYIITCFTFMSSTTGFTVDIQTSEEIPEDYDYQNIRFYLMDMHYALKSTGKLLYGLKIEYGFPVVLYVGEVFSSRSFPFDLKKVPKSEEVDKPLGN